MQEDLRSLLAYHRASVKDAREALDILAQDATSSHPVSPEDAFGAALSHHWKESFETLPIVAIGLDREACVRYANEFFCSLVNRELDDVLGSPWFDTFLPEDERGPVSSAFTEVLEKEFHREYENHVVRADGQQLSVHWFNARLRTVDGKIAGTFSLGQDVTGLRKLQSESAKMEHELQEALAQVPTLSGFLPICAHCKRIREDDGYWKDVAQYVMEHAKVQFSHGLCPSCLTLYDD